MKIGFAQVNTTVGDFPGNAERIARAYRELVSMGAELVVTPELALCGYPPLDLLFKRRFVPDCQQTLERLAKDIGSVPLVCGTVEPNASGRGRPFFNAASCLAGGRLVASIAKTLLPTYDVFDEARYFEPARRHNPIELAGRQVGITICEDIWSEEFLPRPLYEAKPLEALAGRCTVVLNLSASPFHRGKPAVRRRMVAELAARFGLPIAYCNAVGGNDQLVFDGHSLAAVPAGVVWQGPSFREAAVVVDLMAAGLEIPVREDVEDIHDALVLGLRDYMRKCGFQNCLLGLSGGIDSAVTCCLAVEAAGRAHVLGVLLPSPYSSEHSVRDARALAQALGIRHITLPIHQPFAAMKQLLADEFAGMPEDITEENLQARLRGVTLMALSNKFGSLLLTTGNKSELAVGYCTLYGDMCGGLAVISDVPKTMVYELARFINRRAGREIVPRSTLEKPPSAELRPNQTDQDTLPPYETLDEILRLYVEENLGAVEIAARGFNEETVRWVLRRVDLNEYKRQQAAPGLKVTGKAFGVGRVMPIAQKFIGR